MFRKFCIYGKEFVKNLKCAIQLLQYRCEMFDDVRVMLTLRIQNNRKKMRTEK